MALRLSCVRLQAVYYACESDGMFTDEDNAVPVIVGAGYCAMTAAACAVVRAGTSSWVGLRFPRVAPRLRAIRLGGYAIALALNIPFGTCSLCARV